MLAPSDGWAPPAPPPPYRPPPPWWLRWAGVLPFVIVAATFALTQLG